MYTKEFHNDIFVKVKNLKNQNRESYNDIDSSEFTTKNVYKTYKKEKET